MRACKKRFYPILTLAAALLLVPPLLAGCGGTKEAEKVSAPGEYTGYSEPLYDGYETTSQYVTSFDGTRIAVDVHRPTGGPDEPLPAILIMTPYHRASIKDGEVVDVMSDPDSPSRIISSYGYVIVVADVRGTGASFGSRYALFFPEEIKDGDSIVDWIAEQDWSDGNVGMMGQSYLAMMQWMNASNQNPHLKAIIPRYSFFDMYDFVYPGGILDSNFIGVYDEAMEALNMNRNIPALGFYPSKPVDSDTDGSMLAAATAEHETNFVMQETALQVPFRDSLLNITGEPQGYQVLSPSGHQQEIEDSGVVVYNMGGWLDCYITACVTFQEEMANPSKCLIGDYDHTQHFDNDALEAVRFFDRYLKGIENGIEDEADYYIYTSGRDEWRFEEQWPLPDQKLTDYYLDADGVLSSDEPAAGGTLDYTVDYTTSSGKKTRWLAMTGEPSVYEDRAEEDEKCLSFTTEALEADMEITGHPILHLYVSSTADDGDFFVYLEDIGPDGYAQYKTEGQLRASLRKLSERPWLPDIPFHRCYQEDVQPLVPGEMVEMVIELYPISHLFMEGHSIRVSLAGADDGNFSTPELSPPPTWTVYYGGDNASYIEFPVIE